MSDVADFENMMSMTEQPIKSNVCARWERKQQAVNQQSGDRFIPNRANMDKQYEQSITECSKVGDDEGAVEKLSLKRVLSNSSENDDNTRVLSFKQKAPLPKDGYQSSLKVLYSQQQGRKVSADSVKSSRHIPSAPVRILDAPDLIDDYYLNLLSWGSSNVLAVALQQSVYLWDASSSTIKELLTMPNQEDYVSSVSWIQHGGSHLAVGTSDNSVQLWDTATGSKLRTLQGHSSRVGCLAWNGHILTSGSRDNTIINHDVRVQNHIVGTMTEHTQEVCGLSWSPDGQYLASGANDNTLKIYDVSLSMNQNASSLHSLTDHQAAVKALAWSPHERNLLASGGGTADRCIKFWNASNGALVNSIDTGSQVCALQWSPTEKELLSSHGFADNQLTLWSYPRMLKIKELRGHTSRVLHMATSPDGNMVCSAAASGDETLRFWSIFGNEGKRKQEGTVYGAGSLSKTNSLKIR